LVLSQEIVIKGSVYVLLDTVKVETVEVQQCSNTDCENVLSVVYIKLIFTALCYV